jgi:hypothetical protein
MITGPWRTLQSQSPQQPGSTECGTHLLLNIMRHIPAVVIPDTATILWSTNMRTHLTNFLGRIGLTDEGAHELSSDEDVEYIPRPPKRKVERATPRVGSKRALPHNHTPTDNKHPKRIRQSHTDHQGKSGTTTTLALPSSPFPHPPPFPRTGGPAKRSRTQVSTPSVCTVYFQLLRLLRSGTQINETGC